MNENGITSIDMPWAAWALPATSPMVMKTQRERVAGDEHQQEAEHDAADAAVGAEADERGRGAR